MAKINPVFLVFQTFLTTLVLCEDYINIYGETSITPETLNELRKTQLLKLNQYRSLHGVSPLSINETLNGIAQNYAKYLYDNNKFNHSSQAYSGLYGENLFRRGSMPYLTYNKGDATKMWYDQIKYYDYVSERSVDPSDPNKIVGHFTTQIWKSVTSVGFGFYGGPRNYNRNGQVVGIQQLYVVANYFPTPNIIGLFHDNVLPPL